MEQYRKNILLRELNEKMEKLSQDMERFNLAEYLELLNNPRRYLWLNFAGGLFRGLGIALGATILGALVLYMLQRLVVLNLPVIGDLIAELVRIVQVHL
nr:DUF5665 domain-containing protein [Candidatus Contubernalis alkalaceticus]